MRSAAGSRLSQAVFTSSKKRWRCRIPSAYLYIITVGIANLPFNGCWQQMDRLTIGTFLFHKTLDTRAAVLRERDKRFTLTPGLYWDLFIYWEFRDGRVSIRHDGQVVGDDGCNMRIHHLDPTF